MEIPDLSGMAHTPDVCWLISTISFSSFTATDTFGKLPDILMISSEDAELTLGVQCQCTIKAGCAPCLCPNIHRGWGTWSPAFPCQKLPSSTVHGMTDPAWLQGKFLLKIQQPHWAKTLLSPSRRLFPEVNAKLYDVKHKFSVGSWQDFGMFCRPEGNDRSKTTHEFSSLLET